MNILGISCFYHDAAAALLIDDQLVAAAEEECFSRRKHDSGFPVHAIAFCLRQGGITAQELDYGVFYEKPLNKFARILSTSLSTFPQSWHMFCDAMISWFNDKLWIKDMILKHLSLPESSLLFVDHHMSHAASAFFCTPFKEAAIVTADGVGEWTTASLGRGRADWGGGGRSSIILENEIRFPHSLGILYSAFTAFLGFEVNEGEYKVMGMAPYGQPLYLDEVSKIVKVGTDGSFRLNLDYFAFTHSTEQTYSKEFVELFGEPRKPTDEFFTYTTHPKADHPYWTESAAVQKAVEDALLDLKDLASSKSRNLVAEFSTALDSLVGKWDIFHNDYDDFRSKRGPLSSSDVASRLSDLVARFSKLAFDGRNLPTSQITRPIAQILVTALEEEDLALRKLRDAFDQSDEEITSVELILRDFESEVVTSNTKRREAAEKLVDII